ncbi:DUF4177 domain-containing protein [Clostridiaceae bacterium]|nr:DUF4177 domain-containing protein [Clostridiaceae bacterium]
MFVIRECKFERYRVGGGRIINNDGAGHREVISKYLSEGWRYAGWVPLTFTGEGAPKEIDLIFERQGCGEGDK